MGSTSEERKRHHHRPKFHFTANSWINDPCAPGYDPETKTYHLFYQCNPESCEWGNMSWGHIVSKDMINWLPASISPALVPDQPYDSQGIFTGCWIPSTHTTNHSLTVAYSSIKHLPFHWSTPPYPRDAAGLAVATSCDGGRTWEKSCRNPILAGEPEDLQVTGFRDPYVTESSAIDDARNVERRMLYGLISGGIEGSGPTTFLYQIEPENIEAWRYLGPLVDIPMRFQPSHKWSGNYGLNWECTNVVTLHTDSETRNFLIIGAEGDVEKDHVKNFARPAMIPPRTVRAQLWMSGRLNAMSDSVRFEYQHGGYLDNGPYYAANSFLDPMTNRRIVYGWIPEEDITLESAKHKGWNGSLAMPREIFLLRIPNVQGTLRSELSEISPFELKTEPDGSITVLTLGMKPISEMVLLRKTCHQVLEHEDVVSLPISSTTSGQALFQTSSASWELETTIIIHPGCEDVGFHIRHSKDLGIRTTVTFSVVNESIIVDRAASNTDSMINKCPDAGPFTLLRRGNPGQDGEAELEKIQLRIFSDGDVLEIFANDRFALATMVYSDSYDPENRNISAFATGSVNSAIFEKVTLWDGLNEKKSIAQFDLLPNKKCRSIH